MLVSYSRGRVGEEVLWYRGAAAEGLIIDHGMGAARLWTTKLQLLT